MISVRTDQGMERALTGFGTALRQAGSETVAKSARAMKADLRRDVVRGGLGARLSRSWRDHIYPDVAGKTPTALVFSTAPHIIAGHSEGVSIRARGGGRLAIPTAAVPRGRGGRRLRPKEVADRLGTPLRVIARPGRPSLLVADNVALTSRGTVRSLTRRRRHSGAFTALTTRSKRAGVTGRATVILFVLLPLVRLPKRLHSERLIRKGVDAMPDGLDAAITRRRT